MSAVTRIGTVIVPVSDQDKALEFYVGTLGCEVRLDAEFAPGQRWLEVAPPGAATSIALVPGDAMEVTPTSRRCWRRASTPTRRSSAWASTCRRCSRSAIPTATASAWSSGTE